MFTNRKIFLVILLLITLCISAYVLLILIPRRLAEQSYEGARTMGRDLKEAFQFTPRITVNNKIIVQQQSGILELATLSQKFHRTYTWKNTRLGSTKEIEVSGTFVSKAGFDLNKEFLIRIEDGKATVEFPQPTILSIESLGDIQFRDENGYWNWVNEDDRTKAINAFTGDARRYAEDILSAKRAGDAITDKILRIIQPHVREVEIRIGDETIRPETGGYNNPE